jgi:hypothetical protein
VVVELEPESFVDEPSDDEDEVDDESPDEDSDDVELLEPELVVELDEDRLSFL